MRIPRGRTAAVVLAALALVSFVACGNIQQAAQKSKNQNLLMQVGLMYHNYHDANNKGPSGPQDLAKYAQGGGEEALAALQSGQFTIIWNVKIHEQTEGTANTVLGYESSVPQSGGAVLFVDGTVRRLTAQDFAAAPKAKPSNK